MLHIYFYSLSVNINYMVNKVQRGSHGLSWTERQSTINWKPSIGPCPTLTKRQSPESHSDAWTFITPQETNSAKYFVLLLSVKFLTNNLEFKVIFTAQKILSKPLWPYLPSWWKHVWVKMWESYLSSSSFTCFQIIFHFLSGKIFFLILHYPKQTNKTSKTPKIFPKIDHKFP